MTETISLQITGSVARVMLNRPDVHNAMNQQMIEELLEFFTRIHDDRSIRCVVIEAAGKTFCAGGDINDMQKLVGLSHEEKAAFTGRLDPLLRAVNEAPQVTIAKIQGAAMGGGLGLVCVSDIAIASQNAVFGLPEVRIGVAPALISPYVIQRIGLTRARQWMLTGKRFDADAALSYGLIHEVCPPDELDICIESTITDILECSPNALSETKQLIFHVMAHSLDDSLPYRADLITRLRDTEDGQEGMRAFIEKRKPSWAEG
jgi:enoyl-CoA hydratase/carnithine racemase